MTHIVRFLLLAVMIAGLAACGKSDQQKQQETTQSAVDEHNALARQINAMGTPSGWWDDAKLNAYEAKLNRLDTLRAQLEGAEGVSGGSNAQAISVNRMALQQARQQKAQRERVQAGQSPAPDNQPDNQEDLRQRRAIEGKQTLDAYVATAGQLDRRGFPDASWTEQQLDEDIALADTARAQYSKIVTDVIPYVPATEPMRQAIANLARANELVIARQRLARELKEAKQAGDQPAGGPVQNPERLRRT